MALGLNIRNSIFIILLALCTVGMYLSVLDFKFTGDDHYQIDRNDFVRSLDHFPRLFKKDYLSRMVSIRSSENFNFGSGELSYRPVTTLTYFIDYFIWKLDPAGYHLTNLVLHFLCSVLVYFLALRLDLKSVTSFVAALIFLLHPVNSEVVAVVSSRDDAVAFLFFGSALLLYLHFKKTGYRNYIFFFGSVLLYIFAMFSKEMAVTLPLIIVLHDFLFSGKAHDDRKNFCQRLKLYAVYMIVAGFYLWIWNFVMSPSREGLIEYSWVSVWSVFATIINILAKYIVWLIVPIAVPAAITDPRVIVTHFYQQSFLVAVLLVFAVVILIALVCVRQNKKMMFALFWGVFTIWPVLHLTAMFGVLYAARFLYIPMIGLSLLLAVLWEQQKNLIIRMSVVLLIVFFGVTTFFRLPMWKDDLALAEDRLKYYPQNAVVLLNAGAAYVQEGMPHIAIELYLEAIHWDPECWECYEYLGMLYNKIGEHDMAFDMFRRVYDLSLTTTPEVMSFCNSLGERKLFDQAEKCFKNVITAYPALIQAYYNLGVMYVQSGRRQEAVQIWERALVIEPQNQLLLNSLERLGPSE